MMSAKKKRIIIIISIITVVAIFLALGFIMGFFEKGSTTYAILVHVRMGLLIALWGGIIAMLIVAYRQIKKDSSVYSAAVESKNYGEAIEYFAQKVGTYVLIKLKLVCKLYLVSLYLMDNRIDSARELLKSDWKSERKDVLFFKILVSLYDGNIAEAERDYSDLLKLKVKELKKQQEQCKRIFSCISRHDFSDKFYLDSTYPIVKDIYDRYYSEYENGKSVQTD